MVFSRKVTNDETFVRFTAQKCHYYKRPKSICDFKKTY